jgi:small subunit ribosomal protein S16
LTFSQHLVRIGLLIAVLAITDRQQRIMLTIKLSKLGKKNHKLFRVIITEKGRDPYGHALEVLGSYDQYQKKLQVKNDRVTYWLSKGAQMTNTINNLLVTHGVIDREKIVPKKKTKTSEKRQAQRKAKADKQKEAEKAVASETPAEEPLEEEIKPEEEVVKEEIKPEEEVVKEEIKPEETAA